MGVERQGLRRPFPSQVRRGRVRRVARVPRAPGEVPLPPATGAARLVQPELDAEERRLQHDALRARRRHLQDRVSVRETPYVFRFFFDFVEARISVSLGPDSGSFLGTS